MDPADFYTGLVAELYAPLRSGTPDADRYVRFVREHGEPALELGCGDGDPILELRAAGLDVDGIDSSPDMLDRCAVRAAERGLTVTTYCQRMEELDLPRRYASMYIAGGTFTVLPDDEAGLLALQRISAQLQPDGAVLVPLWVPPVTPAHELGVARSARQPDGSTISVAVLAETRDAASRTRKSVLRYERRSPDGRCEAARAHLGHPLVHPVRLQRVGRLGRSRRGVVCRRRDLRTGGRGLLGLRGRARRLVGRAKASHWRHNGAGRRTSHWTQNSLPSGSVITTQ